MRIRADFHIHSCLSPCASLEMSPAVIVDRARSVGLSAVALSDHNCGFNLPAFAEVCAREKMPCLYGIEATSAEEAHMLCLFDDLDAAMIFADEVYAGLPPLRHDPDRFGDQPIINADEEVIGFADKFLISASDRDVSSLLVRVHELGGLFIPAHIDRAVFGLIAQLGFLPDEAFDAVELTPAGDAALACGYPIVRHSDAHDPARIGKVCTEYELETFSVPALREALIRRQGSAG